MKQKKMETGNNIPKSFVLIFLIILWSFYFGGCTTAALQIAEEKASPENCEYRKIESVVSAIAIKQEKGDISVCLEMETSDKTEEHKLSTITLPLAVLTGENNALESYGLRSGECPFEDANCFWYPIEKAQPDCKIFAPRDVSTTSAIPIEKLELQNKDRSQLYDLLDSHNNKQQVTEKIYEVHFVSDDRDIAENKDNDDGGTKLSFSREEIENKENETEDILLIYRQVQSGQQRVPPISIAGTYKDKSTNLYYLTIPLAFTGDVALATTMLAVCVMCPLCCAN
jgi:hypothetical protein